MDNSFLIYAALAVLGWVVYQRSKPPAQRAAIVRPSILGAHEEMSRLTADRIVSEHLGIEDALAHADKMSRIGERLKAQYAPKADAPKS